MIEAGILEVRGAHKSFGGIIALDDVYLSLAPGEVHALIGPNGAGKTTLVSLICGEQELDAGEVYINRINATRLSVHARARLGLSRTYQLTQLFPDLSVGENILLSLVARDGSRLRVGQFVSERAARRFADEISCVLEEYALHDHRDALPGELSHGDRRRLELAMAIVRDPKILLLDEPLAGLSAADADALIEMIAQKLKGAIPILLIEHDMDAVFSLADTVTVLVNGKVLMTGRPDSVKASKEVQLAYLSEEDDF